MKYYTYAHFTQDTKKLFYIGKGSNRRAWQTSSRNRYWTNVVKKHGRTVEILAKWDTEEEAFEHERFLIGCFEMQLVNLTDGGEGTSGRKQSEEEKSKRSKKLKGISLTKERKTNISISLQGRKLQPEHAEKSRSILASLREEAKKKVKCVTTGFVYSSVTEAGKAEKVDPSSIVKACKGILKEQERKNGNMSELNFALLKWQQEVFKDPTRFKVVAAGRRCGKSRLSAVTLLIEALNCPEGSSVMYVAPTLGQARTIIWDLLHELGRPIIKSSHINNLEISLINGRKILVRGADNPDSLRGVSLTYLVLDECAFIKEDVWQKILRAALSDKKGRALFISTPSGRNWLYEIFKLGQTGEDPDWKSWHFTTADNETIDPKEIEAAKRTLSSFAFKQEYLSSFDTAGADLFKPEWIKEGSIPDDGTYVMAIDLAGFENISDGSQNKKRLDETAMAVVKIGNDNKWYVQKIEHGRWDIKDTCMRILKNIKEYQPTQIGIERGTAMNAVMGVLQDMMRQYNTFAHIQTLTHGNKKKTDRVVWALQGRFEHGHIILNEDEDFEEFKDQLIMFPTKGVHDDLVDALAYVEQLAISAFLPDYEEEDYETYDVISGY